MRAPRGVGWRALLGAALLGIFLSAGSGRAAETIRPLVQGEPPPDFALSDTAGRQVRLSDYRGRTILVSFVSCYTDTCFAPLNVFEELLVRFGPARLAALTVCAEVPEALRRDGYAGLRSRCSAGQTILLDDGQTVSDRYLVKEFPTSVLVGPDFTVRELLPGLAALRDPALPGRIEALANQGVAPNLRP
jgi:peroxiredoxin